MNPGAALADHGELERDILDWEIAACRGMLALLVAAIVLVFAIYPWIGRDEAVTEITLAIIAISFFLLQRYGLERLSTMRRPRMLEALRWTAVAVEVSFGSAATLLVVHVHGAAWAATSPVTMVYLLCLVTASFRLRPALSAFAVTFATVQWLLVYRFAIAPDLDPRDVAGLSTLGSWAAWERASWLFFAGGLMTVATHRLRRLAFVNRVRSRQLERLVSHATAELAVSGDLHPGASERRWATVLFCDLRDFTALCEHRRGEDVLEILNAFYGRACRIIEDAGGEVNKFLGDGVLALFSAPGHAAAAVECARQLARAADQLRDRGELWADLEVGIGLDTGDVVLGAVGTDDRLELAAIGATVNRAARLQALSTSTGRRIVLSARTATELDGEDMLLPLGEATIKGVERAIRIYTPR